MTHVDVEERMIDFQIVGMPLPKDIITTTCEKTIQAKTRGKSLDHTKSDRNGKGKRKRKQRKGKMHVKR